MPRPAIGYCKAHLVDPWRVGKHISTEPAGLFCVGRSAVYRAVRRAGGIPSTPAPASG